MRKSRRGAGARRVEHEDIRLLASGGEGDEIFRGVRRGEAGVPDTVPAGVEARVGDGGAVKLYAQRLAEVRGHRQAERAHAAVSVDKPPAASGELAREGVQLLRLGVVDLVEGPGREAELEAAEPVENEARAVQRAEAPGQHMACPGGC